MKTNLKEKILNLGKYGICNKIKEDKELYNELHEMIFWIEYDNIMEKLYYIYNDVNEIVKCKQCGNKSKFDKLTKKYNKYCSRSCAAKATSAFKNPEIQKKAHKNIDYKKRQKTKEKSVKEKYGVDNIMHVSEVADKVSNTLKSKSKEEWNEIKDKRDQTMEERYNIDIKRIIIDLLMEYFTDRIV